MRISEDASSWRARGILRRDFRHTHGEPEVDTTTKVRRRKSRTKKQRPACKHVWVQVDYHEYVRYADSWYWRYLMDDRREPSYWVKFSTYYVCAGCLETNSKRDKGRERVYHRREFEKRRRARARAS